MHDEDGPDKAFERFVARRRERLLGVAGRILGDEAEAEDVVQDTLLPTESE